MKFRIPKIFFSNKKYMYAAIIIFSLVAYSFVVYAAAPSGGYTPGATLDPDCAPGDVSPNPCIVQLSSGGTEGIADVLAQNQLLTAKESVIDINGNSFAVIDSQNYPDGLFGVNKDGEAYLGDNGNDINGTEVAIDDNSQTVSTVGEQINWNDPKGHSYLAASFGSNPTFNFGDLSGNGNGTTFTLDDPSATYTFSQPNFNIFGIPYVFPSKQGNRGDVLTNEGNGNLSWASAGSGGGGGIDDVLAQNQQFTTDRSMDINGNSFTIKDSSRRNIRNYSDGLFGINDNGQVYLGDYNDDENGTYVAADDGAQTIALSASTTELLSVTPGGERNQLQFYGGKHNRSYVGISAPGDEMNSSYSLVLPPAQGNSGDVLTNDGNGNLSWAPAGGGGGGGGGGSDPITVDRRNNIYSGTIGASPSSYSGSIALGTDATNTDNNQFYLADSITNFNLAGVNYNFPTSQAGESGDVLTNDSNGNLTWTSPRLGLIGSTSGITGSTTGFTNQDNVWLGEGAGANGGSVYDSTFLGYHAGDGDTAEVSIAIGSYAGFNADGESGNYIGYVSGYNATNAYNSNFIGDGSGSNATNAASSVFIGENTGVSATNAASSVFIGSSSGFEASNAANSIFIGNAAGSRDTVDNSNFSGTSILIGDSSSTGGFSNSIALGTGATNTMSNQFLVASAYTNWDIAGVDYAWPSSQASASGDVLTNDGSGNLSWAPAGGSSGATLIGSTSGIVTSDNPGSTDETWLGDGAGGNGASTFDTVFIGIEAGNMATGAVISNFLGYNAGVNATSAYASDFLGSDAGANATNANNSNFLGHNAGANAANANDSNFLGSAAGLQSINANDSNFLGYNAGQTAANANDSNFLGYYAGISAINASNSNFFGENAGLRAINASNSNFFGENAGGYATNSNYSTFIGIDAGAYSQFYNQGTQNAAHSIFIGNGAGYTLGDASLNNTQNADDYSILIGNNTSTGGFSNSIALGANATNTASNQFIIGSTNRPINSIVMNSDGQTGCTIVASGLSCSSDERLKTNITPLSTDELDTLDKVQTVNFNWDSNPSGSQNIGFLAQDIQQYYPQLVSTGPGGYLQVNYAGITPVLVESIRELNLKLTDIQTFATSTDTTFLTELENWLASATNGIANIFSQKVTTNQLCIGTTCITQSDLDAFKTWEATQNQNGGGTSPAAPVVVPAVTPSVPPVVPDPSSNTQTPTVTPPDPTVTSPSPDPSTQTPSVTPPVVTPDPSSTPATTPAVAPVVTPDPTVTPPSDPVVTPDPSATDSGTTSSTTTSN